MMFTRHHLLFTKNLEFSKPISFLHATTNKTRLFIWSRNNPDFALTWPNLVTDSILHQELLMGAGCMGLEPMMKYRIDSAAPSPLSQHPQMRV